MSRSLARAPALLAVSLFVGACASTESTAEDSSLVPGADCAHPILVVQNNTAMDLEIVRYTRGSGGQAIIAMVTPGRHEIEISTSPDYSYSARAVGGTTVLSATSRPRVRDRDIRLERRCRAD